MPVSPVIERELKVALRKQKLARSRFLTAAAAAAVVTFFLLLSLTGGVRIWIRELQTILFYMGLAMAVVPAATRIVRRVRVAVRMLSSTAIGGSCGGFGLYTTSVYQIPQEAIPAAARPQR